jgi:hypothetical protein
MKDAGMKGLDPPLVEKAGRMHAASEHKRRLPSSFAD